MNKVVRTVSRIQPLQLRQCFFHSSPILERRRGNNAGYFSGYYKKRSTKRRGRSPDFADDLFKSWQDDFQEYHPSSKKTQSSRKAGWFTENFFSDTSRRRPGSRGPKPGSRSGYDFCGGDFEDDSEDDSEDDCEDDYKVEYTFHTSFGDDDKDFYYAFTSKDFESDYTSSHKTRSQRKRRQYYEYESSEESNFSATDLSSYRKTLGLNASGPLRLEDVKNAYRSCALKWHPDRHQGSYKTVAEEKFKTCSAAYQSLCDKLAVN